MAAAGMDVARVQMAHAELNKVAAEVANYKSFEEIVGEIVSDSETICEGRAHRFRRVISRPCRASRYHHHLVTTRREHGRGVARPG